MESKRSAITIPLAIIAAGGLIAAAVFWSGGGLSRTAPAAKPASTPSSKIAPVGSQDHILGDPSARAVVVEYSDLECPFCKSFHSTMHEILATYQGRVAWVYRHFPIKELHSRAPKEAEASECAADQGGNTAFWNFIDKVFARTGSNDTLPPTELPKIAQELGLDVSQFNACLSAGTHTKQITDAVSAALDAGAQGTPYSMIVGKNGQIVEVNGAESYESVKAKLDAVLK